MKTRLTAIFITLLVFYGLYSYTDILVGEPTMIKCSELKKPKYPKLSAEAEEYFQTAYKKAGASGERDYKKIAVLYQKSADLGHWKAMNNLAILYYSSLGVAESEDKALELIEQMQQYEIPEAYNAMAWAHERGLGKLIESKKRAKQYLAKAAEFADPKALHVLGDAKMLEPGREATLEAIKLYECAISMGYGKCATDLATAYHFEKRYKDYYDTLVRGSNMHERGVLGDLELLFRVGRFGFPKDEKRSKCIQSYKSKFYGKTGKDYKLPDDIRKLCPANVKLPFGITGG